MGREESSSLEARVPDHPGLLWPPRNLLNSIHWRNTEWNDGPLHPKGRRQENRHPLPHKKGGRPGCEVEEVVPPTLFSMIPPPGNSHRALAG